jgi:hypothetical protein
MEMNDKLQVLVEEWKQNVALYIDQDKRGLERIKMFLTVHAGLIIVWGVVWKVPHDLWSTCAALAISGMAIFLTLITQKMSRRAHGFILLRRDQAMLIEMKIKEILAPLGQWRTSSGIMTTFIREHVSFRNNQDNIPDQWKPLLEEVNEMDCFLSNPLILEGEWGSSIGHLRWLILLHYALYTLWSILVLLTAAVYIWDC